MNKEFSIGIVGGGSWATALVKIFSNNFSNVNWWLRNVEDIEYVKNSSIIQNT